ncbi:MAG: T9SS type A sorting domain-containing protein, partial [Cyclobacteriaceae bacterium]
GLLNDVDHQRGRIDLAAGTFGDLPSGQLEAFKIRYERLSGSRDAAIQFVRDEQVTNGATYAGQLLETEIIDGEFADECFDCPNGLSVYPNGSTGRFNLYLSPEVVPTGMLRLSGVKGETIVEIDLRKEVMPEFIDISTSPKGVYILQMETENGVLMKKLLKY